MPRLGRSPPGRHRPVGVTLPLSGSSGDDAGEGIGEKGRTRAADGRAAACSSGSVRAFWSASASPSTTAWPRSLSISRRLSVSPAGDLKAVQQFVLSPALATLFDVPWFPFYLAIIFLLHQVLGVLALVGGQPGRVACRRGPSCLSRADRGRQCSRLHRPRGLEADELKRLGDAEIKPGMPAQVFITGQAPTVVSYLTKPIADRVHRPFRDDRGFLWCGRRRYALAVRRWATTP
jgi:hypothetical protein